MDVSAPKDKPEVSGVSIGKYAPSPRNIVLLHDLDEVRAIWQVGVDKIYRAVARGDLRAYGRPGHRKYYSEVELMQVFGEPPNGTQPPSLKAPRKSAGVDGRQLSFDEIRPAAEAA